MKRREGIEFWKRHLEAWRGSGLTQEAYCRERALSFTTFARWRNRINRTHKSSVGTGTAFVPVTLKPAPPVVVPTGQQQGASASRAGHIEIRLANARTIEVRDGVDELQLSRNTLHLNIQARYAAVFHDRRTGDGAHAGRTARGQPNY
jgi:hypothetical protein